MKRYYVYSFLSGAICMFFTLLLLAHIAASDTEKPEEYEHIDYVSEITSEQCFVCGYNSDSAHWGEDNVAILNLNCFEMLRLEINRYDDNEQQIEEPFGYYIRDGLYRNDTYINSRSYPDRGYATAEITSLDYKIDREMIQKMLCQTCLDEFNGEWFFGEPLAEFALISLKDRTIHPLLSTRPWIAVGNFGVDCEYESDGDIDILVHNIEYRYGEPGDTIAENP